MVNTPYRVAFVRPEIQLAAPSRSAHTASLVLWFDAFERCVQHPRLAVLCPDQMWLTTVEGTYAPGPIGKGGAPLSFFSHERRDEVLWLELGLDQSRQEVRLHAARPSDEVQTFDAVGDAAKLGELVDRVMGMWLEARGFEALPLRNTFSSQQLLTLVDAIEPALSRAVASQLARERPMVSEDDTSTEAANEVDATPEPEVAAPPELPELPELPEVPVSLKVAALRSLATALKIPVTNALLELDPGNPWALAERFESSRATVENYTLVRAALERAPWWSRLLACLSVPDAVADQDMPGKPDALEQLGACGVATVCAPADKNAHRTYAAELTHARRHEEVSRMYTRGRDADFRASTWLPLLDCQKPLERPGQWRRISGWAANTVGLVVGGVPRPWNPWSMRVDLLASSSLRNVGLLGEAIVLRENRLEGLEARFPQQSTVLQGWRKQARFVAWGFAREGYFRGEDARVLEGFSRAEPNDGVDLGMFMESLLACGRIADATLAWAHLGQGRGLDTPFATRAAVRVLLAAGRTAEGFELRMRSLLSHRRFDHAVALDRSARLLATADLEALEDVVDQQQRKGAPSLAGAMATEVADFVVGADRSSVICGALGPRTAVAFDDDWLARFESVPSKAAIDRVLAVQVDGASLEQADALVEAWAPARFDELAETDTTGLARTTLYVLAHALARYLVATTHAPSVMAGALRCVAGEALLSLHVLQEHLADADIQAMLGTLDDALTATRSDDVESDAIADAWLLRVEEALHLEERTHGRLHTLCKDTPRVAKLLRGPEVVALETLEAARLLRAGDSHQAAALLTRVVRATGPSCAAAWADAAFAITDTCPLDVLFTAAFVARGVHAGPSVLAARTLFAKGRFAKGRGEDAFLMLCEGMSAAPSIAWRDEQLELLRPLWTAAGIDVPFDFGDGVRVALDHLQGGDGAAAERLLHWLLALDPGNDEGHRNFGMAYAMQGRVEPALAEFAKASRDQDTQFASGSLFHAGHPQLAMAVLDYASQWYTRAEQWLTFGAIAFQVMDNPRTVIAYANAWELDPDAYDTSNLNSYAGVLDEVGDYAMCQKVAERLIDAAGEDAMWASNGWHHLACAFIGQGKLEEAVKVAQRAIDMNPLPDNTQVFAETLERAASGARPPVPPPLDPPVPRHPAFELLEEGEIKEVGLRYASSADWECRIATLRASRYRYGSDNYVGVTTRAREAAARLIADTRGATDPLAVLARTFALDVREQADFPSDPMPSLGDRGSREAFYKEFRDRGGIIVGSPPIEAVTFEDQAVCPDTAVPNASDYVRLLKTLADKRPAEALTDAGLTEESFVAAAVAWGTALRRDSTLGERLAAGMREA